MEKIIEEYGTALLGIAAGSGTIAILWQLVYGGGPAGGFLIRFMQGICG